MQTNPAVQQSNKKLRYLEEHSASVVLMGVEHRGTAGDKSPQNLERGIAPPPQILSCCTILSSRLLALECRKMCFCLYSRTFIVSPAMHPPELQSDLRLWSCLVDVSYDILGRESVDG